MLFFYLGSRFQPDSPMGDYARRVPSAPTATAEVSKHGSMAGQQAFMEIPAAWGKDTRGYRRRKNDFVL